MADHTRLAVMLDGGFVTKRFESERRRFPEPHDVQQLCAELADQIPQYELYRIFFYDANPYREQARNPISKAVVQFGRSKIADRHRLLLDGLAQAPNFALRRGELIFRGWKLGSSTLRALAKDPTARIGERSLVPDLVQKGVDMRIGLDMAALALKRLVQAVVLVTGDSDMVPAMRFARREGLRVYLHTMGLVGVRSVLKAEADIAL